jgi:hypothetical protein
MRRFRVHVALLNVPCAIDGAEPHPLARAAGDR